MFKKNKSGCFFRSLLKIDYSTCYKNESMSVIFFQCYSSCCTAYFYQKYCNIVDEGHRHVFSHVCPGYNFEPLHIETSFLVCRYIFTISRSSLSIKVIGSRSYENYYNFTSFNMLIHCLWLEVINKVKVTHQGEIKICTSLPISCHLFCPCIDFKEA